MQFFRILAAGIVLLSFNVRAQTSVKVELLNDVLVDLERRAPADVQPLNDSLLSAEVAAVIKSVHAEVGQEVTAGTLLVQLDATDYLLNLEQAEANLASAQAQKAQADSKLKRARELIDNQYLSADELVDRETDVVVRQSSINAAEVLVRIAQRNLEKCSVVAPFNGVVAARPAQVGSFVGNGAPLMQLVQIDEFELDAEVPASVADSLLDAEAIWFESRNQKYSLVLLRLSPVIEAERRSRRARFAFSADAPAVGRSGELVWHVDRGLLPSGLLSRRSGVLGVFLNNSGTAVFTPVPGAQEGRPVPFNMPAGTEIITMGRERLQDGDALSISR